MTSKTIAETNDNPLELGIFHTLQGKGAFTWLTSDDAVNLDTEYYLQQSGDKRISLLFDKLLTKESSGIITSALSMLADIIIRKFGDKWNRLYVAMVETEYNPIQNYNGTETETYNTKVTTTSSNSSGGKNGTYGFNSESSVPTGTTEREETSTSTQQGNATDNVRTLTKEGNIGVTSNQDMLFQELNLRKWLFYESIMVDIDNVLCSAIY